MNDIKASVKRNYTRVVVPSAVAVFAAIAIAQGQKDKPVEPNPKLAEISPQISTQAQPIPVVSTMPPAELPAYDTPSQVRPAGAEFPMNDGPAEAWNQPSAAETTVAFDPGLPGDEGLTAADPPIAEPPPLLPEETYESVPTESVGSDLPGNPYRAAPPGLPPVDSVQESDGPVAPVLDDPSPMLPDQSLPESTYQDPPVLPEAPAPTYEPQPAEPLEPSIDPAREPASSVPQSDPVEELLESNPISSSAPAAEYPSGLPAATAPPAALEPSPAAAAPSTMTYSDPVYQDPLTPSPVPSEMAYDEGSIPPTGKPGPQTLEGPQTPSLTLEKLAPQEVQVGLPAKFEIHVRNVGRVTAENVRIRDEVPLGTNFVDANPKADRTADGAVFWDVGNLAPGQEAVVTMELLPVTEGQVGSVATVSFEASATARSRSTKPELVLEHTGPKEVLVGEPVRFQIKLSNPGTGAATQVVLEEDVPPGLAHSSGAKLEYEVGRIEPGQTRHLELTLQAAQPGHVLNQLTARADAGLSVEDTVEIDVVAPKLQVGVEGPGRRYLDRQATFTVTVANPGTAPAHGVELVAQLPAGLKFVSTNNSGYYDQNRHAVIWSLEKLPAGEMGKAQFTALATEMGEQRIRAEGKAQMDLQSVEELSLAVEGIAALLFNVSDQLDPIEVGGQSSYEIKVVNQGSKAASNVRLAALVPDGLKPLSAQGPTVEQIQGQQIVFEPLSRLEPQQEATFRVMVQGGGPGDHRFRVQLTSDEMSEPVTKEESTRVYQD